MLLHRTKMSLALLSVVLLVPLNWAQDPNKNDSVAEDRQVVKSQAVPQAQREDVQPFGRLLAHRAIRLHAPGQGELFRLSELPGEDLELASGRARKIELSLLMRSLRRPQSHPRAVIDRQLLLLGD